MILTNDELDEIERWIAIGNPHSSDMPLRRVIASHRALSQELAEWKRDMKKTDEELLALEYQVSILHDEIANIEIDEGQS